MGPVEFIVLAFPEEQLRREAVDALAGIRKSGSVRLIDSLVVAKSDAGKVATAELGDFEELQDVVTGHDEANLIGPEDVEEAAAVLSPASCALLLLVEHVWAAEASEAVREAGGRIAASVRIPPERVEEARAVYATALAAGDGS
ncbi:DUF6325 family protein [Streptomyces monticola]|uniref:DUF6325 family protein n=1 Tax=Streptomyces monticola TaxID=2666263 RepID=A0ABW2JR41_9ACTN